MRHISPVEIAGRDTGKLLINELALDKLQVLRDRLGKPLIVRSAYRSPEHNRAVGGATRSKHLDGAAFDIAMENPVWRRWAQQAWGSRRASSPRRRPPSCRSCRISTLRWVFIAVALVGIAVTIYARLDDWRRGQR